MSLTRYRRAWLERDVANWKLEDARATLMKNGREVVLGDTLRIIDCYGVGALQYLLDKEIEWNLGTRDDLAQGTCASHRQRRAQRGPRNYSRLGASMCATSI